MSATHFNCPSCHIPVAIDRFERAFAETYDYWVCPECDFTFNAPISVMTHQRLLVEAAADRDSAGANEVRQACATSV